ncbi:MAG: hypothetical protein BroJett040_05050 [Oligoflexia bacterium]|nr:MAG: hypothetical protein BroJett040_05050 [Oligoflexia bacterium]
MIFENSVFTMNYSQPEEYRFSLDSVAAPKVIADRMKNRQVCGESFQVMDICAGCGVMGMELSFFLPQIQNIHFVEVQEVYRSHFEENLKTLKDTLKKTQNRTDLNGDFHLMNYESLIGHPQWRESMDLILANPPYFHPSQGKLSPSEFKNRCRFFIDSSFEKLIEAILFVLKPGGEAYILIRDLQDHSMDFIRELEKLIAGQAQSEIVADIRGTHLVRIQKLSL